LLYRTLLPKWLLTYLIFTIMYKTHHSWLYHTEYYYRPSGHVFCAMISYANWWNLIWAMQEYRPNIFDTPLIGAKYVAFALTMWQLWSLYFTTFIYHHYSESLYGFINGLIVCYAVFHNDELNTSIYRIW